MKKVLLLLLLLGSVASGLAQRGQAELSVYGGTLGFTKLDNSPYFEKFGTGFGFGFQAKYHLTNRFFWMADLFGGTDDGTEITRNIDGANRIINLERRDYSLSTGLGMNLISASALQVYAQAFAGFGKVEGYSSYYQLVSKRKGLWEPVELPLNRTSYLVGVGAGVDLRLSRSWKVGASYTYRYIGDVDLSHSLAFKLTYIIR